MPDLVVVDLSHYNDVSSFADARTAGLLGVIHKATEGTSWSDPEYQSRQPEARAAGLAWASYHFLKHGNATEQMEFFLDFARPPSGSRVCVDYEDPACTLDDLYEALDRVSRHAPSLRVAIYAGALLKDQLGSSADPKLASHALWLAEYTAGSPSWPQATWPEWSLWQYSDGSAGGSPQSIQGIEDFHDCNAFNGSRERCSKWF